MADPIRVALLGYGLAGRLFHAPFIDAVPDLELRAIVTSNPQRQSEASAEYPDAELLDSAEDVFARAADFGAVVVATANIAHVPQATAALAAGLHVVVDKPLAADAQRAQELDAAATTAGRQLHVFQNRRYDSDFRTLRRLIEAGELGSVYRFESRFERWRPDPGHAWRDQADPEQMGGVLYDLGAHLVDQALQLFGPVSSVDAALRNRRVAAGPDDDTSVSLEHANGTISDLWMSSLAAHQGPRFRVLGSRGAFVVEGLDAQEAALKSGQRPAANPQGWGIEPEERVAMLFPEGTPVPLDRGDYRDFYRDLVASLRGQSDPAVTVAEATQALTVMDAARASSRTGRRVHI